MFKWIRITTDGFNQMLEGKKIINLPADDLVGMFPDTSAKNIERLSARVED